MIGLSSSTLVSTNFGLFFINETLPGFRVQCGNTTNKVWASCSDTLPVNSARLLAVRLADGTVIQAADDQRVLARQQKDDWIPIRQLNRGNLVAVSVGASPCYRPTKVDRDLIVLLAIMADQEHELVTKQATRYNIFSPAYSRFFGYHLKGKMRDKIYFCGEVGPKALDILTEYGLGNPHSLPRVVLQAPLDLIQLYLELLQGQYSPEINQQIKLLWQRLGYRCQIEGNTVKPIEKVDSSFVWSPVVDITPYRKDSVYRLSVADQHTYSANGVAVRSI